MIENKTAYIQICNTDNTITVHTCQLTFVDNQKVTETIIHTKTLCPGDDYSNEDLETQKICKALWTKSVIEAYKASILLGE